MTGVREWLADNAPLRQWKKQLLDEEQFGVRPAYGNVVLGDGTRYRVENGEKLKAWVLDLAEQIRAARSRVAEPILVSPKSGQCRPCGQKGHCGQVRHSLCLICLMDKTD